VRSGPAGGFASGARAWVEGPWPCAGRSAMGPLRCIEWSTTRDASAGRASCAAIPGACPARAVGGGAAGGHGAAALVT
jgi:hypothetical protein